MKTKSLMLIIIAGVLVSSCTFIKETQIKITPVATITHEFSPTQTENYLETPEGQSEIEESVIPPSQTVSMNTPVPTQTEMPNHLALGIRSDNKVHLLTKNFMTLSEISDNYLAISISGDGCSLRGINISTDKTGFEITQHDLAGKTIKKSTALFSNIDDLLAIYDFKLSPGGDWLAYKKVAGDTEYSYQNAEIQDIFILKLDDKVPQEPVQLTEYQGTNPSHLEWSTDNKRLAFTDKDQHGIDQIYLYDPYEPQKVQLTYFGVDNQDYHIQDMKWSPDSRSIAFSVSWQQPVGKGSIYRKGSIGIIDVSNQNIDWLELQIFGEYTSYLLWWGKDSQSLILYIKQLSDMPNKPQIVWYDVADKKIDQVISQDQIPNQSVPYYVIPIIDENHVAIFAKTLFLYNRKAETWTQIENIFNRPDFLPVIIPNAPIKLDNCKK